MRRLLERPDRRARATAHALLDEVHARRAAAGDEVIRALAGGGAHRQGPSARHGVLLVSPWRGESRGPSGDALPNSPRSARDAAIADTTPLALAQVERLRQEFGQQVPEDYLAFLAAHDGAKGAVGVLDPAAEVGRGEDLHPELDHLHGLVVFGSNGGLEAFAFDTNGTVVAMPWIGGLQDAIPQGTFTEFLRRLVEGRLFEREP